MLKNKSLQIRIFVFILLFSTAACRINDALSALMSGYGESCSVIDRTQYEMFCEQLGQAPETPKYPEHAVYEVCMVENTIKSVRMSEGYRSDEEIEETNSSINENEINEQPTDRDEISSTIPSGTYTGEFVWDEDSKSELLVNEIIVEVSPDGIVNGTATRNYRTIHYNKTSDGECRMYYEFWESAVVGGTITDAYQDPVLVQKSMYEISDSTDCGYDYKEDEKQCTCEAYLTIKDGKLIVSCGGNVDCGFYIRAYK